MNPAHIHLVLNHLSIVGSIFGFALLAVAAMRNSRELIMVTFAFIVVIALASIAVYFTGDPAKDHIRHLESVSPTVIDEHKEAADFGFTAVECVGALALAGLLLFRTEPVPRWFLMILLVGSLLTVGAMVYTADRGRRIRHTEITKRIDPVQAYGVRALGTLSVRQPSAVKCFASRTICPT